MPEQKKLSWEQLTVCQLCNLQANTISIGGDTKQLSAAEGRFEGRLALYEESLAALGDSLKASRDIVRAATSRRNDADVSLSAAYLQRQLNLDKLLGAIKYNAGGVSFIVKPPVTLLTARSDSNPCDYFGPDQLGVVTNTEIKTKFKTYNPTLHFAVGLSVREHGIDMYVAHEARLRGTSGLEPVLMQLEKALNKQLKIEITKQKFPTPEIDKLPLAGREVKYLAHEVGGHMTIVSSVVALPGSKPLPRPNPLPRIAALPEYAHEVRRIRSAFVLESFVEQVRNLPAQFPQYPMIRLREPVGIITTNPLKPGSGEVIFLVTAPVYCVNDFQDEENYGEIKIAAKPGVRRTDGVPDTVEIYLETFIVQQPSFPFGVSVKDEQLPKPTVMRLTKAIRHDPLLTEAFMSVTVRYRLD